jgi:hypothetical protein
MSPGYAARPTGAKKSLEASGKSRQQQHARGRRTCMRATRPSGTWPAPFAAGRLAVSFSIAMAIGSLMRDSLLIPSPTSQSLTP